MSFIIESTMSGYMGYWQSHSKYVVQFVPERHYDMLCMIMVSYGNSKPVRIERLKLVVDELRKMPVFLEWGSHPLPGAAVAYIDSDIGDLNHNPSNTIRSNEYVRWAATCSRELGVDSSLADRLIGSVRNDAAWRDWSTAVIEAFGESDHQRYWAFLVHTIRIVDTKFRDVNIREFEELQPLCEKIGLSYLEYKELSPSEIACKAHSCGLEYNEARTIENRLVRALGAESESFNFGG